MIRTAACIAVTVLASLPAYAQTMDDFDCVSDLNGPDTPAGIMRISSDSEFAWLDLDTATPGEFHPFQLMGERVDFDPAFAEQITPGGKLIEASYFADAATFEAVVITAQAKVVLVSCPYIY
jgi:hypothetical protein